MESLLGNFIDIWQLFTGHTDCDPLQFCLNLHLNRFNTVDVVVVGGTFIPRKSASSKRAPFLQKVSNAQGFREREIEGEREVWKMFEYAALVREIVKAIFCLSAGVPYIYVLLEQQHSTSYFSSSLYIEAVA